MNNIPVKIRMWDFKHCDSKRCSGKKLEKLGLIKSLKIGQKFKGIVISPNGKKYFSPEDKEAVEKFGIAVVECSWARIDEIPFSKIGGRNERILPYLVAGNTVNYGKAWKLNCVEAISSCFAIMDRMDWAEHLVESFSYGPNFLDLNRHLFDTYIKCSNSESVLKSQKMIINSLELETLKKKEKKENKDNKDNEDVWITGNLNKISKSVDTSNYTIETEFSNNDGLCDALGNTKI